LKCFFVTGDEPFPIADYIQSGRVHPTIQRNPVLGRDRNRVHPESQQTGGAAEKVYQIGGLVSYTLQTIFFFVFAVVLTNLARDDLLSTRQLQRIPKPERVLRHRYGYVESGDITFVEYVGQGTVEDQEGLHRIRGVNRS